MTNTNFRDLFKADRQVQQAKMVLDAGVTEEGLTNEEKPLSIQASESLLKLIATSPVFRDGTWANILRRSRTVVRSQIEGIAWTSGGDTSPSASIP